MKIAYYLPIFLFFAFQSSDVVQWETDKTHHFGEISQFEEQVYHFSFQNISDVPIVIDNVRTTCGCTAPAWSEIPILPDSLGTIAIHYDAKRLGVFKKKIKVFVSGQRRAEVLEISGEVF